jgi:hypothetical protein
MAELYLIVAKATVVNGIPNVEVKSTQQDVKSVTDKHYVLDGQWIKHSELNIVIRVGEERIDQATNLAFKVWCNDSKRIDECKLMAVEQLKAIVLAYKLNLEMMAEGITRL